MGGLEGEWGKSKWSSWIYFLENSLKFRNGNGKGKDIWARVSVRVRVRVKCKGKGKGVVKKRRVT